MRTHENLCVNDNPGYTYSRFVASWTRVCRSKGIPVVFRGNFKDWLRSLGLSDDDVLNIRDMADNGKLELEEHARKWLDEHPVTYTRRDLY